jgi:hypothetical protein
VAHPDELAGAVLSLLEPDAAEAASRCAHELSERAFSLSAVTDTLQCVYGKLVAIG